MADPLRLAVQKNLSALLESQVSVANGYAHDLAGRVHRGRLRFGEKDKPPLVSLLEPPIPPEEQPTPPGGEQAYVSWDLIVQGFAKEDMEHPTDPAYALLHDVRKCLADHRAERSDRMRRQRDGYFDLKTAVDDFQIGSGVVRPEEGETNRAFFWLLVRFRLAENIGD